MTLPLELMFFNGWISEIVDAETTVLYGDLEEEIYMKIPSGLAEYFGSEVEEDECLILLKSIYGLVQAARHFFKKLTSILIYSMGFKKCLADQCLFIKENDRGTIILCL